MPLENNDQRRVLVTKVLEHIRDLNPLSAEGTLTWTFTNEGAVVFLNGVYEMHIFYTDLQTLEEQADAEDYQ